MMKNIENQKKFKIQRKSINDLKNELKEKYLK